MEIFYRTEEGKFVWSNLHCFLSRVQEKDLLHQKAEAPSFLVLMQTRLSRRDDGKVIPDTCQLKEKVLVPRRKSYYSGVSINGVIYKIVIIVIIMYLYSAQYLHIQQDSKSYLTNPTLQVQPQLTSNWHSPNWKIEAQGWPFINALEAL